MGNTAATRARYLARRERDVPGLRPGDRGAQRRDVRGRPAAQRLRRAAGRAHRDVRLRPAEPGRGAADALPRPGRHVRHRWGGARLPARHPAPGDRGRPLGGGRARRAAAGAGARAVPVRRLRRGAGLRRRRHPAPGDRDVVALPPGGGRARAEQRRPGARVRHRPRARRRGRVPGAGGQRAGAVRGVLRHDQPAGDRDRPAGDLHKPPHPPRRRLPPAAPARAARGGSGRGQRPDRRRPHPRCLQRRVLRARAAGPHDGRGAGRGPRPRGPSGPRDDAHHLGPGAGARDLSPGRRRVPRPDPLPPRLTARLPGHARRRAGRQPHPGQRGRQRRRRRQARLHLHARPDPLLPRRGADAPQRRHLAAGGAGPPRGGDGPPRRARGQAGRRLRRQGHRDRPGGDPRGARRAACARAGPSARLDRAAGRAALHRADLRRRPDGSAPRRPEAVRGQRR